MCKVVLFFAVCSYGSLFDYFYRNVVVEVWGIFLKNFFRNTYRFFKILFYTPTLSTFPQIDIRYRKPSSIRYSLCRGLENLWEMDFHKFPTFVSCSTVIPHLFSIPTSVFSYSCLVSVGFPIQRSGCGNVGNFC